jgi:hypothetical protein
MPLARDTDIKDGTLRGVTGLLVKVPVLPTAYVTSGAALSSSNPYNPDGSASILPLSASAGPPNGAWVKQPVAGTVVGFSFRRDSATAPFVDAVIDGIAYAVDTTSPRFDNVSQTTTDYEANHIIATGLPNRTHSVAIYLTGDKVGGAARTINLQGFLAEQGRGYNPAQPPARAGYVLSSTLTATAASISSTTAVTALKFYNTDVAVRTVTIYSSDGVTIWDVVTVPAGGSVKIPFSVPSKMTGWKWKADAASVVTGFTENV